ncbi:MAG: amidohydrolase family protein [Vicinamibacterales bacterium]
MTRPRRLLVPLVGALFAVFYTLPSAQVTQPPLVIQGGTLIDGNGGTPLADAVVLIQGNRIARVGRRGQVTIPSGAHVIDATGKFILPGLFDSQVSYAWYFAEPLLHYGITSTIDVGTSGETAIPYRDAVMHGKLRGPRTFTSISRLNAEPDAGDTGFESPYTPSRVPSSAEHARQLVRLWLAAGADYVIVDDGSLPMEVAQAAFDEAKAAGKPIFTRAYGPVMFPEDAARLGSGSLPHSAGVGIAVTRDPSKWNKGRDDRNELDRYAEMDEEKAKALIDVLVSHKVMLVPTFIINFPGYPKDWQRFVAEGRALFTDPDLRSYYPQTAIDSVFARFERVDQGAIRERRLLGYRNALRFHKMFVDAGGRLVISGNTNSTKAPGLDLMHEIQVMADAGLTPMQIIQGTTKWPAEMIQKQDLLGTIEAGKLADVIVLTKNPLLDPANMATAETVIQDGRLVDRGYHANYRDPFSNVGTLPSVDALPWVLALKKVSRPAGVVSDPASSPQPAIESITPIIVTQGDGPVTVTLEGVNFVRRSTVYVDGRLVQSRVVSSTEIQVTLDGAAMRAVGKFDVVVRNPPPMDPAVVRDMWGSGTSNAAHVIINYKY